MATDDPVSASPPPEGFNPRFGLRQTWELELLISGAVAFALLQIPSGVTHAYQRLDPHLAGNLAFGLFAGYYYVKLILYALITSFILHLALRAYWVGLIGLEAVFPGGVRWEELKYGPVTRDYYHRNLRSLPAMIDKVDDFCSLIFSFSFLMVLMFALSLLWGVVVSLAAFAASRLLFGGEHFGTVFQILGAVFVGFPVVLSLLDRTVGARLDPAGLPARALRKGIGTFSRLYLLPLYGPTLLVLVTNIRKQAIYPLISLAFGGLVVFFLVNDVMLPRSAVAVGSGIYLPNEPGTMGVDPVDYEDQQTAEHTPVRPTPSIQSDIVTDPYVRLFIPYLPARHNAALAERCPGVKPLSEDGMKFNPQRGRKAVDPAAAQAVLGCLATLHRVTLDGRPLPDLDFFFSKQPRTGLQGIVAYIPATSLAPGAHVLQVEAVPREKRRGRNDPPPPPHILRFWR